MMNHTIFSTVVNEKGQMQLWFLLATVFLLTSCQLQSVSTVNHPSPAAVVDFDSFREAGCPADEYGLNFCNDESPLAKLGCEEIREPNKLIGSLKPSAPIAMCLITPHTRGHRETNDQFITEGKYFYNIGGIVPSYVRYVIWRNGQFQLIETKDDFRKFYAPIENADEALSYALVMTNLSAYYGLERKPNYVYYIETLEDTHVNQVADGYIIRLYDYPVFGCGPHITSAVDAKVTYHGEVKQIDKIPAFKDPAQDDLCVD